MDVCSTPSTWAETAAKEVLVDSEAGWEATLGQLPRVCGTLIEPIQYLSGASFSCPTFRARPSSPCCAGYRSDASQSVLETIGWHVIWPTTNHSEGSRSGMLDIHSERNAYIAGLLGLPVAYCFARKRFQDAAIEAA